MMDKLSGIGKAPALSETKSVPSSRAETDASKSGVGPSSDQFTATDLATKLQAIEAGIREMPVVDEAKVNAARQAVESGNLRLDAEALANALAKFEIDLFEG